MAKKTWTKTRVRRTVRETRTALRQLERALLSGDNASLHRASEEVIETAEMAGRSAQEYVTDHTEDSDG